MPGRLIGGGIKPQSPGVTNLQAHWDASNAGSVHDTGGLVDSWDDLSGHARTMTATLTARPTTGTRTQNSLNVFDFDGTNDSMITATQTIPLPITMFLVCASDITTSGTREPVGQVNGVTPMIYTSNTGSGNKWAMSAGTAKISSTAADAAAHQLSAVFATGAACNLWLDGTQIITNQNAVIAGSNGWNAHAMVLGHDNLIALRYWNGWIAEQRVYSGALSTTDRQAIEATLKAKWGTP